MTAGPRAKWNSAGSRMSSRKNPVLPGLAPRTAYSDRGQMTWVTPGSDSMTRNGSPSEPAVRSRLSSASATPEPSAGAATTVS